MKNRERTLPLPTDDDEAEEDTEENNSDMEEEWDYNEDQNSLVHQRFQGWYCVLCSKLDISKKKVIHDPRCSSPSRADPLDWKCDLCYFPDWIFPFSNVFFTVKSGPS